MTQDPKETSPVTCIVPVYNEVGAVAETLSGVADYESQMTWEISAQDHGSECEVKSEEDSD